VADWFKSDDKVGICGATSTPTWLMEQVRKNLQKMA
jgi:4-hydroxy-3-methylbut-2-en-1-yl diphosphate reductase